jgi:hypothetical protein
MPQAGAAVRLRRNDVPWWEELDSEAFREFRASEIADAEARAKAEARKPAVAPADIRLEPPEPRPDRQVTWAPRAANGRRTVYITGRGVERNLPVARPTLRRHERAGFKPDRTAMWAVLLGLLLILVAATSAHAAVVAHVVH